MKVSMKLREGIRQILLWTTIVLVPICMLKFVIYGHELRYLMEGVGFALMAYGEQKNSVQVGLVAEVQAGRSYVLLAGLTLVVASFVWQSLLDMRLG